MPGLLCVCVVCSWSRVVPTSCTMRWYSIQDDMECRGRFSTRFFPAPASRAVLLHEIPIDLDAETRFLVHVNVARAHLGAFRKEPGRDGIAVLGRAVRLHGEARAREGGDEMAV